MPSGQLVARKTITTIQDGSVYRERFTLPEEQPPNTTVRMIFKDSAGGDLAEIIGEVDGYTVTFRVPYAEIDIVPNGAGFYCYVHQADWEEADEEMVRYGAVFRRELTFPNSPATSTSTVVRQFEDSFQRPAGPVGGRWKVLLGRPKIYDNSGSIPNTVGPDFVFLQNYFMYYYIPFNDDSVEISFSAIDKGTGYTFFALCCNSSASSYLYLGLDSYNNRAELGYGTGPNMGNHLFPTGVLHPQITPVSFDVPDSAVATYIIRYSATTKKIGFYNADKTVKFCEWADDNDEVPHGRGYRYFGVGGVTGILDQGVQIANIKAQGIV